MVVVEDRENEDERLREIWLHCVCVFVHMDISAI